MFWAVLCFYSVLTQYRVFTYCTPIQLHIALVHIKCTVLLYIIYCNTVAGKYDFQPELFKQSNNDKNPKVSLAIELHQ